MKKILSKTKKTKKTSPIKKEYIITVSLNDTIYNTETSDLKAAIKAIIPRFLKTRVIFYITKGDLACEKLLLLREAQRVFRNDLSLEVFINRLVFK